jgi:hypothetical protein
MSGTGMRWHIATYCRWSTHASTACLPAGPHLAGSHPCQRMREGCARRILTRGSHFCLCLA